MHFMQKESKILDNMLKANRIDCYGSNHQKGTSIIYDNNFWDEMIEYYNDDGGRYNFLLLKKHDKLYLFGNIYAPNDHSISFFDSFFLLHTF